MAGVTLSGIASEIAGCNTGPLIVMVIVIVAIILLWLVYTRLIYHIIVEWLPRLDKLYDLFLVPFCVGGPLLISGVYGVAHYNGCPLPHSIFEAVLVAGVIVGCVDPILKWRLLHEFARDLFPQMIGFNLPPKIRERLSDMVCHTKLYRKDMTMTLSFSRKAKHDVIIRFETGFDLANPTSGLYQHKHHLQFEEAEKTKDLKVTLSGAPLVPPPNPTYDSGVYDYRSDTILVKSNLKPNGTTDPQYHFMSEYTQEYPIPGFHIQTFGLPTVGFTLTLKTKTNLDDIEVLATPRKNHAKEECEELKEGNNRTYDELFMKGESIHIRWRERKTANKQQQECPNKAEAPQAAK